MYADRESVGPLAVNLEDLRRGDEDSLHRCLVATMLFQRLRDELAKRILRQLTAEEAAEFADPARLIALADASPCPHLRSVDSLRTHCDLTKDPHTKRGLCRAGSDPTCHLKRHTERLKRYGHFGKFPTSLALMLREAGVSSLGGLYREATRSRSPEEAAEWLIASLSRTWRLHDKISCMYLSVLSNPDVLPGAPWSAALAWERFVVIDVNVDKFLAALRYDGARSYEARRAFVTALARRLDLAELRPGMSSFNPRIVQQAFYLFMSRSNRLSLAHDCIHSSPSGCAACPLVVRGSCPRSSTSIGALAAE